MAPDLAFATPGCGAKAAEVQRQDQLRRWIRRERRLSGHLTLAVDASTIRALHDRIAPAASEASSGQVKSEGAGSAISIPAV